jgi:hypothetical protein
MDSPYYCHEQLTQCTSTAADDYHGTSIDVPCETYTEETSDKTNTSDHDAHCESVLDSSDGQEVSGVDVHPRRPYPPLSAFSVIFEDWDYLPFAA